MPTLSDGEFRIMDAIWSDESGFTQAKVMKTVNQTLDKKLNVSTFATYLRRIIRKGYLVKIDHGDGHPTYQPQITREQYFDRNAQDFSVRWGSSKITRLAMGRLHSLSKSEASEFIDTLHK